MKQLFTKIFGALAWVPAAGNRSCSVQSGAQLWVGGIAVAACCFAFLPATSLRAQQHKSKVPILGKLTSGPQQQAYSGTVQSLDLKQKVISVNSRQGRDTEIFPVKKDVRVETINGKKMNLKTLTPGTSVLIYYDQKRGERTVKYIIVLEAGKGGGETQDPPAT